jgi:hypothetical protein
MAATQAPMNDAEARVIDPILTAVARGFRSRLEPVAEVLFPRVNVDERSGKIMSFGADDFRLMNTVRAHGANTKRITYGYGTEPFSLEDYRLEGTVPAEVRRGRRIAPRLDLLEGAIRRVRNVQAREREKEAADLALNPNNYSTTHKLTISDPNDQWNDPDSDPFTDVLEAKEVIRADTGEDPNVFVLGPRPLRFLRSHPKILDRLSTARDRPPATLDQLATLFEVDRIVRAGTMYFNGTKNVDMWGTAALLAFTTPASEEEQGSPNFGYTYQLTGYPNAEEPYLDRNPNVWAGPVADARRVVMAGPLAGFLFVGAVPAAA